MKHVAIKLAVCCLFSFSLFLSGNVLAQDGRYVIKKKVETGDANPHYLAHVKVEENWVLQDATTFSPACLWISDNTYCPGGTNKNYYFYDDNNTPRFLESPEFQEGGALSLSTTIPSGSDLGTPEYQYYFYRWDSGLGRGVQYFGVTDETCTHEWKWMDEEHTKGECWEVYWVSYDSYSDTWKLSDKHYELEDVTYGARYHAVAITEHHQDTATSSGGGGLTPLSDFSLEWEGSPQTISPSITTPYSYYFTPAYTEYVVNESYYGHEPNPINVQHNYWGGEDHGEEVPDQVNQTENSVASRYWTITGDAAEYLSFSNEAGSNETTSSDAAPTLYYSTQNTTGDKTATLRLVVTYGNGAKQTSTATVTVLTPCQNPAMIGAPEVTETGVTLSWYPTATSYMVSWQKAGASSWNSVSLGNVTSYTIRGLDFATTYYYKVRATSCTTEDPTPGSFTTSDEPEGLVLFGAVFGGGRMADVDGKTEVVIINASDINAVYGGNDIAGKVRNENGSTITLGVDTEDPNDYDDYGITNAPINIGSVYGGGNGYYAYNGSSFVPATDTYSSHEVAANGHVNAMTQEHEVGEVVWTNTGTEPKTLEFPSIAKTNITVTNDYVKVDSLFGGAKNAFLTNETNDVNITINGGTLFTVFGGNNFGGTLGAGSQEHIVVNNTLTKTTEYHGLQLGRDFGIGYLFGGGNKVAGQNVLIDILGGQMDTIFGGGNAADVLSTQLTVNCALAAGSSGPQFGKVFSEAITACSGESPNFTLTIDENYNWECSGIYNIRTLFGGNNRADMEGGVPNLILTSGSIGTVYGGGNAGDMKDSEHTDINFDDLEPFGVDYSTHVVMNSPTMLVDYLYGGCQMSNVLYSTWVELQKGHVGTVYGGCNISGDVGSTRANPNAPYIPVTLEDQEVNGGTYVKAGGSADANVIVYNNLIAGSNGYYDCSQDGIHYKGDSNFDDPTGKYDGLTVPTHNETHAIISDGATIKGNVYAGGNLACVGFDDGTGFYRGFPELIGLASLRMDGGTVNGNVYGGGNLASIYGINEVRVSGGTIGLALYGGNDCSGQVAEKTNRLLPDEYTVASNDVTSLTALGVKTYVGVSGNPQINTVYGGGNGVYAPGEVEYCYSNFEPVQSYTFVDIHIDGGTNGGHIGTVYGGGNGVTVRHGVTVFLNVQGTNVEEDDNNHVDVVFGGNNKGDLNVVSDIILLHGKVGTVYGGCNQGAMIATDRVKTIGGYENIGSYVRLMDTYDPDGVPEHLETVTAKVTDAVYGGCRMNGVTNNSLVLVEGGNHSGISLYGGSDISGTVSGKSMVAVTGGAVGNVYGGGNGNYDYTSGNYSGLTAPTCVNSGADILGGTVGTSGSHKNVYGGGLGEMTNTTGNVEVNIGAIAFDNDNNEIHTDYPLLYGDVYGGSALGSVNNTLVNVLNGEHHGNIYGGGLGQASPDISATVTGDVVVNIGKDDSGTLQGFAVIDGNVFGANNIMGSPEGAITVNVYKGSMTNVFGGGNLATTNVSGNNYPAVNIYGGTVAEDVFGGGFGSAGTDKGKVMGNPRVTIDGANVVLNGGVYGGGSLAPTEGDALVTLINGATTNIYGGGKAANVTGDPTVLIQGGTVSTGVYGGCNTSGTITGNTTVTLTGGTIGTAETHANVHGGGFGEPTSVTGNVTVTFGTDNDTYDENLHLYGDLYGGSALGNVNTYNQNKTTTVDVFNGIIDGHVFGGGLGSATLEAKVFGKIHVNIGKMILNEGADPTFSGKANLNNCSVFGCNNVSGSPMDQVYVDVYSTYRRPSDEVDAVGDVTYAIANVFGGGNQADYSPASTQKTHVYVHGCENTAEFLYAGGNAADAYGVEIVVEGGRFGEAYGGGNGLVVPANIGDGGIGYNFHGGHFGFTYEGSNKNGGNTGGVMEPPPDLLPSGQSVECGGSFTDSHFFGANEAEIYVDVLENIIRCEDAESYHYKNVYAGSRWAIIYGDVKLTVCGGEIENLFGGSQGYRSSPTNPNGFSADIRKYPTFQQIYDDEQAHPNVDERKYSQALKDHMGYTGDPNGTQPSYAGDGGNITLIVNGGVIGNVIGGSNVKGNAEGKITVIVEDAEANTCELHVGNVFGGSNEADYWPTGTDGTDSPKVTIIKGSLGMEHDFNSNGVINEGERFEGNVFGGGNKGDITALPKVIVGDGTTGADATKVSIGGSVFGGGNEGHVTGSANVIVVPIRHLLTVTPPGSDHIVSVTNSLGQNMNGQQVGEGHVLMIQAISSPYGYKFDHWECENGTIAYPNKAVTTFTMGTADATATATITAVFADNIPTHTLNFDDAPTGGTVQVIDGRGIPVTTGASISEGAVLHLVATPADAVHEFHEWTATNGTIANTSSPSTTFTMGTDNTTITAIFSEITTTHTLTFNASPEHGTFTVKDAQGTTLTNPATVGEGVTLNLNVTHTDPDYTFIKWTATTAFLGNEAASSTTFRMGAGNATLSATFAQTYTFTVNTPVNGTVRVLDGEGNIVNSGASVGAGATLHLKATPIAGYAFKQWTVSGTGASLADASAANTTLTMGTEATTLTATFVPTHILTLTPPEHGTVKITNTIGGFPVTVTCPASIGEYATLQLKATPAAGYHFSGWTVTGTNPGVSSNTAETTFTMGTEDTNIQATFELDEP